jgi:hypothetical protein
MRRYREGSGNIDLPLGTRVNADSIAITQLVAGNRILSRSVIASHRMAIDDAGAEQ